MSSSDVSSVTKYFVTANEGFNTTLGSTIAAGATSVGLNSTSGLTNGSVFVGIIEPGATAQQVFTGTVDVSGAQITNVVWTRGTNVGHAGGVTIVDYSTGTARNMATTGILKQHTQAGAHVGITNTGGLTTDIMTATGNATVGGTLGITGATTLTGAVGGTGYSLATISNPYKFRATAASNAAWSSNAWTTIVFNAESYDTGNNFNGTDTFTAPINGFYQFNLSTGTTNASGNLQGIGLRFLKNNVTDLTQSPISFDNGVSYDYMNFAISDCVQLTAGDTIKAQGLLFIVGGNVSVNGSVFSGYFVSAT